MNEQQLQPGDSIHTVTIGEKRITIIATAHVSKQSQEEVKQVIDEQRPEGVAVELDTERFKTLKKLNDYSSMDIVKVIKEGKALLILVNLLLSSYQKKIAQNMEVEPGCEMLQAIKSAEENSAHVALVDRDIQVTLKRIWRKSTFIQKILLINQIAGSFLISGGSIKEEDIEEMKQSDMLDSAISLIGKSFPLIKRVLIDERDRFIAHKIINMEEQHIVVVLGAAHVPGVKQYLTGAESLIPNTIDRKTFKRNLLASLPEHDLQFVKKCYNEKIRNGTKHTTYTLSDSLDKESTEKLFNTLYTSLPKPGITGTIIGLTIPAGILIWIVYGFFNNKGIENILSYILGTGLGAMVGSLAALAHPLTALLGFLTAPITVMHPVLGVGWFTGLSEAMLKKPTVSDLENLGNDIKTIKGFYHNRFSRILLVVLLSSLGTNFGVFVGIPLFNRIMPDILKTLFG